MKGKAVVHKKSTNKTDERETPSDLFARLDFLYNFTLDAAATDKNAKCKAYYTKKDNALLQTWKGRVFCNPPYSRVGEFVRKAESESKHCEVIVMLLPARTDTRWFHDHIWQFRQTPEKTFSNKLLPEVSFLKGRLKFENNGKPMDSGAPFPSMIVVWRK